MSLISQSLSLPKQGRAAAFRLLVVLTGVMLAWRILGGGDETSAKDGTGHTGPASAAATSGGMHTWVAEASLTSNKAASTQADDLLFEFFQIEIAVARDGYTPSSEQSLLRLAIHPASDLTLTQRIAQLITLHTEQLAALQQVAHALAEKSSALADNGAQTPTLNQTTKQAEQQQANAWLLMNLIEQYRPELALQFDAAARAQSGANAEADRWVAGLMVARGQVDEALARLEAAPRRGDESDDDTLALIANYRYLAGQTAGAIELANTLRARQSPAADALDAIPWELPAPNSEALPAPPQ